MGISFVPGWTLSSEIIARIDRFIAKSVAAGGIPGASLVIIKNHQIAYSAGYGLADIERQIPMTSRTLIPIGSTGKGLTALAIMRQVERGALELDAPVTRYLPYFTTADGRGSAITIRQLLSHTSGLPAGLPSDHAGDDGALERHVRSLAQVTLHRAPGEGFEYANDGFSILGALIQAVTGVSYEEYMEARVFAPLAMRHTTFDLQRAARLGLAQGYIRSNGALVPREPLAIRAANPAGMAISSANDVGNYFLALLNGGQYGGAKIISPASLAEMWRPQVEVGNGMRYGLGWFLLELGGAPVVAHNGDTLTSGSSFALIPSLGLGVGVILNRNADAKADMARGVVSLLLGQEPPEPQPLIERGPNTFVPNPAIWGRYVGEYASQLGALPIFQREDKLLGSIINFTFELEPFSDTEFVAHSDLPAINEAPVSFRPEEDGSVTLLVKGQPFGVKR
jgi:CubicO group peptidase (beta-lactamase class C family)